MLLSCPSLDYLFGNALDNSVAFQLIQVFFQNQNLIFVAENHVYKHSGNVCNDVTL